MRARMSKMRRSELLGASALWGEAHLSIARGMALQCTGGWEMLPTLMQWFWYSDRYHHFSIYGEQLLPSMWEEDCITCKRKRLSGRVSSRNKFGYEPEFTATQVPGIRKIELKNMQLLHLHNKSCDHGSSEAYSKKMIQGFIQP